MKEFERLVEDHRAEMLKDFSRDVSAQAMAGQAADWLLRLRAERLHSVLDEREARLINRSCAAAAEALRAMGAVSEARLRVRPAPIAKARSGWTVALRWGALALMALIAVVAAADGERAIALLAVLALIAGLLDRRAPGIAPLPEVEAEPRVDAAQLVRAMECLARALDEIAWEPDPGADNPELSRGVVEGIQMLMEARLTDDGRFALSCVPQLVDALERQGVEMRMFAQEDAARFDLLPAKEGGETIRPAVVLNGQTLSRGQATVGME